MAMVLTLRTGEYHLRFPSSQDLDDWLVQQNFRQELLIGGPGDGATGFGYDQRVSKIVITEAVKVTLKNRISKFWMTKRF